MKKMYYWMASCEMTFQDSQGGTGVTRRNALTTTEEPYCTMKDMAKIQQGAQINLFNMLGEQVEVGSLTVISINNIGHMTEEEFNNGAVAQVANDG